MQKQTDIPARHDMRFEARLFGDFALFTADGANVTPSSRKARALLAYLLLARRDSVSRDRLAGLLWGDRGETQARASLRQTLHELRGFANGDGAFLISERDLVRTSNALVATDVDRIHMVVRGGDIDSALLLLGEHPCDLLTDLDDIDADFDEWLAAERIRQRDLLVDQTLRLGKQALEDGRADAAQSLASAALRFEPGNELAATLIMDACRQRGDRDGVRRAFAQHEAAMRQLFDATPTDPRAASFHRCWPPTRPPTIVASSPNTHGISLSYPNRRQAILVMGGAAMAAGAYFAWRIPSPRRVEAMKWYEKGRDAQREASLDNAEQAIADFTRATRIDPGFAEAWGALALQRALNPPPDDGRGVIPPVTAAGQRALKLDPQNQEATLALVLVAPYYHNWRSIEAQTRNALARWPDKAMLHSKLGSILSHVGRWRDGIKELLAAVAIEPLVPSYQVFLCRALVGNGDLAAAQSRLDRAQARWPNNSSIWNARFTLLTLRGMASAARAMSEAGDISYFAMSPVSKQACLTCGDALASGDAGLRSRAVEAVLHADKTDGLGENLTIPYLSALGAIDAAFAKAYDFYLGERDPVTGERQPVRLGAHRETTILFQPATAAMRADPRFAKLTALIGLDDYWRASGSQPDYRNR